ncbi:MAG: flavodoxin family protein [Bacilli bacterium]|nr:flavodoxin family protein [Bacilli bacterium]
MRTIIHDLSDKEVKKLKFSKEDKVISSLNCSNNCIGCFNCWIKHPKKCAIKDEFSSIVEYLKYSDELILVSKCRYGCYSSSVKRVLERCIGYVLPHFTIRNNEIHHQSRYDNKIKLCTYFYGDISKEDKKCVDKLVKSNSINIDASKYTINYVDNLKELEKCIH